MKHSTDALLVLLVLSIAPLYAQTPKLQFSSTAVPTGNGPRSVILIDLDRDGNRDLAVANIRGSTISLIFGDGSGTFTPQDTIANVHKAPHAIATGDFNEDGLPDAVTANRDANTVGVFIGDGAGGFLSPTFFATGGGPRWIAIADFDEDGHADLAVTNRDDDNVTVLLGDGNGGFVKAGDFHTGDGPVPIEAADFDGDGFIDLAVGNDLGDTLVVLAGDGLGGFALASENPVGKAPKNIAVGDLNQDGISDIAVACLLDGTVTLLFADVNGIFTTASYPAGGGSFAVVIEDFDGDGKSDLAVADGVNDSIAILLNDGGGSFAEAQFFPAGVAPHAIVSGDFNGDGRPDLAVANTGDNTVTILLNETPMEESVNVVSVIQQLYSDYFPDPIISPAGQPLRLLITTNSREHVNRLRIRPFIVSTDIVRVGEIMTVEFTPQDVGLYQIQNIGHGFTGDIMIVEDAMAVDEKILERGRQAVSLIHSNAETLIFPPSIRVVKGIPLTIHNISLDSPHWVSIEPWVSAPLPFQQGNVRPRAVTTFEFTPDKTGRFVILHTVHGFSGTLIVEDVRAAELKKSHALQPADDETDSPRDVVLSWTPGDSAASVDGHILYFSENVDDVLAGIGGITLSAERYDPGRLDFSKTYYWRVDEVNGPPDFTVFTGDVWSFTTEPISYPVTHITATASGSLSPLSRPEKTIDGSGLNEFDLHNTDLAAMWLSAGIPASIQYEFDRAYKLHELWVWNANQVIEFILGFGAKDVVIEHSLNGSDWTVLDGVGPLAQAPGAQGYAANNVIDFGGATAQFVRMTINSVHGAASQASLSEVRFHYTPVFARSPQPADGTNEASLGAILSWRPGREAVSHQVYFSAAMDEVLGESTLIATTSDAFVDLSGQDLKYGRTYYWQVNEVNDLESPAVHAGNLWHFKTPAFNSVDDMESYRDERSLEISAHWVGGADDPFNGSIVGNATGLGTFLPETDQIFAGKQSLPLLYDNGTAPVSEATRTFDPPLDWVRGDPQILSLFFLGDPTVIRNRPVNDPAPLYVVIEDSSGQTVRVDYPDPAATHITSWTEWAIPLSQLGSVNLSSIQSMTLGIGSTNGRGKMFFDNIRVGTPMPQTP
ncbi:MAG: VCBS repeat-containing protein [Planctomycetes bacterium]|nr:VCBS repeat-containing protein [Planctomycetota bacterium]